MSKVRVYEVAKQLNLDPKEVVGLFQAVGINDVKNQLSSVDVDAVERVKRHLEKKQTHDVVEERIRPTVVKRRAVARPAAESGTALPAAPASKAAIPAPANSERQVGDAAREGTRENGHGKAPVAARSRPSLAEPVAPGVIAPPPSRQTMEPAVAREPARDRESGRLPEPVAAPPRSAPAERRSSPAVTAPPSTPDLTAHASPGTAPGTAPGASKATRSKPADQKSTKSLPSAPSSPSVHDVAAAASHAETSAQAASERQEAAVPPAAASAPRLAVPPVDVPAPGGSEKRHEPAHAQNGAAPAGDAHPSAVDAARDGAHAGSEPASPASGPPSGAERASSDREPVAEAAAASPEPPVVVAPVRPVEAPPPPPPRPKTGVEYWGGRPGVPMPTPATAQRTGIGGGPSGTMARRVQYDPRAGAGSPAGARGPARPGGQQSRGPMMGRGGPGGFRGGRFGQPIRRGPVNVSTKEMGADKKVIRIEENITLQSMAGKMSMKSTELLMKLLSMGMTGIHINTTLDADTAKLLASEFGWEVEDMAISDEAALAEARGEAHSEENATVTKAVSPDAANLVLRPPVVTVMGHVDHGKTSLLDRIRKANVASGEAGGITQHIGAYKVTTQSQGVIVFLDTPGHEAFTQMRARGASVTDLIVLVVAADDGVMPQTKEAIAHARAAKSPIIVAVNKIDKPSAEPERVRRELVEQGLQPEEWGGDTIFVNVSAQTGEGVETLLEMINLTADVMDLRANPKRPAEGTVIEALLDRGRGPVARVLVQDGTLRVGDFLLAGPGFGKVRAMTNEHGKQIHEAGPSTPVEILGLSEVPGAGDPLHVVKDSKKAQEIAESRKGRMAKSLIPSTAKMSLEEISKRVSDSGQELRLIIKGDVQGSVEAVADALAKLSSERVRLAIIHAGVGAITEGDVNLAIASKAIIVGFNVRPAGKSSALAEENKIEIRLYSIIYNAVDDVKGAMEGLLPPTLVEKVLGRAEVRMVMKVKNVPVAGSYVIQGEIKRAGKVRVLRENAVLHDGKIAALKRFKDDVKDVQEGFECGISIDGFTDLKEKDILECYEIEEVKQKL